MEVIPPVNLQNTPAITTPQVETPPEEEKKESFFDFIKSSIFELFLVLLFSIIILTTFNYFKLIPLSSIFSPLSFLPQQQQWSASSSNGASLDDVSFFNSDFNLLSACNYKPANDIIINTIVNCNKPLTLKNNGKNYSFSSIPGTDQIQPNKSTGVQINLAIKIINNSNTHIGLVFGGGNDENRFYLTYYPSEKAWGDQFFLGSRVTDFSPVYLSSVQRINFSLKISGDGKTVTLILPNGKIETINSNQSFYAKDNSLPIGALLPLNSQMIIYSLNYFVDQ